MSKLDKEEKTAVICPTCGEEVRTWGVNYFNHCGARHSVPDNLAEAAEPEEETLTEKDLEDGENLVKCSKCGDFLITNEETEFTHCNIKQSVKDNIADFKDLNGGEEDEKDKKGSEDEQASPPSTRTVLPTGKTPRETRKEKKNRTSGKTRKEKEEPDESENNPAEEGKDAPDKEEAFWVCVECDELYSDEGRSDARCPVCNCEYASPWEE